MKINPEYVREHLPDIVNEETGKKWITRNAKESDIIIIETKYDGECCFVEKRDGEVLVSNKGKTMYDKAWFLNRNHIDFYNQMCDAFYYDGIYMTEFIAEEGNVNQFNVYQSAIADGNKGKLRAKVYDILELESNNVSSSELKQRRQLLNKVIKENESVQLVDSWELDRSKGDLGYRLKMIQDTFDIVTKEDNMEGLIIKFSNKWIKKKVVNTIDAVVIAVKKTKEYEENGIARSFLLGLKVNEGDDLEISNIYRVIGCLSSGFNHEQLENDMPVKPSAWIELSNPSSIKKADYVPVNPSIVLEVKYLSFGEKMRQPRLVRIRTDKLAEQCNINQIIGEYKQ
jgi:ATP-dependent DNA ligase